MTIAAPNLEAATPAVETARLAQLREASGTIVGSTFFGTILANMRNSKIQGAYGHGGRGEQIFMAQLHGVLAERMGSTGAGSISDALYRRLSPQVRRVQPSVGEQQQ